MSVTAALLTFIMKSSLNRLARFGEYHILFYTHLSTSMDCNNVQPLVDGFGFHQIY